MALTVSLGSGMVLSINQLPVNEHMRTGWDNYRQFFFTKPYVFMSYL
jgi:hypothetical protein